MQEKFEPKTLPSNSYWGRHSGAYYSIIPKGHNTPFGNAFKQGQWGHGSNRNTKQKTIKLLNVPKKWVR